jgi:uncharacterized oligopeptide transporter (OPT) family protein
MTIATLMATSPSFWLMGWTSPAFGALAITIGGVVCIAASNSGDTSQDLKTGYIIGATPRLQQIALMIGVVVSTVVIGFTLNLMNTGLQEFHAARNPGTSTPTIPACHPGDTTSSHADSRRGATTRPAPPPAYRVHHPQRHRLDRVAGRQVPLLARLPQIEVHWIQGIGSEPRPRPQAKLMATVINGILSRKLPWGLVLLGVALVIAVELLGIRSLTFAVGAYLPIGTTLPIFVPAAWCAGWSIRPSKSRRRGAEADSEISPGSLFASGLIAAGGIVGLIGVALKAIEATYYDNRDLLNVSRSAHVLASITTT